MLEEHTFKLAMPEAAICDSHGVGSIVVDPAAPATYVIALVESTIEQDVLAEAVKRGWEHVGDGNLAPALTTYTQTYSTTGTVIPAYTPDAESSSYSGINGALGSNCAAVTDLNALRVAYENLRIQFEALMKVVNKRIDDDQARGVCA